MSRGELILVVLCWLLIPVCLFAKAKMDERQQKADREFERRIKAYYDHLKEGP